MLSSLNRLNEKYGGKMCDLCSTDKDLKKYALQRLIRQQDCLTDIISILHRLNCQSLKPHSDEYCKTGITNLAKSAIRLNPFNFNIAFSSVIDKHQSNIIKGVK